MQARPPASAYAAAVGMTVAFGLSFVATKTALKGFEPLLLALLRFALAGGILWVVWRLRPVREPVTRAELGRLALIGFVSLTNLVNRWPGAARVNLVTVWDIWSKKAYPENQKELLEKVATWKAGVDVLVVAFHDGVEYAPEPDPLQQEFYRQLVEAGVDVFWGHHPHVLQPWKWVATDRGPRLLMYSLGNFVSRQTSGLGPQDGQKPMARRGDGALMQVTLTRQTGGIGLSVVPVPLNNYLDPVKGTIVVPTEVLVREAPAAWRGYYQQRWAFQQAWATPGD